MVTTIKSQPNHYERLGLAPTASAAEVAQAFARKMSAPRAMGDVAQLGIAYATLRDPTRRQAYDLSLGLTTAPEPSAVSVPIATPRWSPFLIRAAANGLEQAAKAKSPAEPHVTPSESAAQPEFRSPIGQSLQELAKPAAKQTAAATSTEPSLDPEQDFPAIRRSSAAGSRESEGRSFDWKYPGFAVGSLVLVVGLLGGWAGTSAGSDAEATQADPALTVPLPEAKEAVSIAPGSPEVADTKADLRVARHETLAARTPRTALTEQPVSERRSNKMSAMDASADPLAPDPDSPAEIVSASMPLPSKIVARTIDRIGYSCGEVASTTAVDAATGVYKVTCSSGQSYQATPVGGRYHFRRTR